MVGEVMQEFEALTGTNVDEVVRQAKEAAWDEGRRVGADGLNDESNPYKP